jgi:hypothetical protein
MSKIEGREVAQIQKSLTKKNALEWKTVETIRYSNSSNSGEEAKWDFSSRDTIIYDASGNEILRKTSRSSADWSNDSLEYIDSIININGKISEILHFRFHNWDGSINAIDKNRTTYTYFNDGKVIVTTIYNWNDTTQNWEASWKDSLSLYSSDHISMNWDDENLSNFVAYYNYYHDVANASWTLNESCVRIDTECTATRLVISIQDKNRDDDSITIYKWIMNFGSSNWDNACYVEEFHQKKNPVTGRYCDSYREIYLKDSHHNDTLSIYCYLDSSTSVWDTEEVYREDRTYNANGNNNTVVVSHYDKDKIWQIDNKYEIVFDQINTPIIPYRQASTQENVPFVITSHFIRFSSSDLTGLKLYDPIGRLLASAKQKTGPSITLDLSGSCTNKASGACFVEIFYKKGKKIIPLVIQK